MKLLLGPKIKVGGLVSQVPFNMFIYNIDFMGLFPLHPPYKMYVYLYNMALCYVCNYITKLLFYNCKILIIYNKKMYWFNL